MGDAVWRLKKGEMFRFHVEEGSFWLCDCWISILNITREDTYTWCKQHWYACASLARPITSGKLKLFRLQYKSWTNHMSSPLCTFYVMILRYNRIMRFVFATCIQNVYSIVMITGFDLVRLTRVNFMLTQFALILTIWQLYRFFYRKLLRCNSQ